MVLPAPPAHASPVEPHWFDKVVVAIELSAHGVLTLVDHAAPSRLREAFLRLRSHDPATGLIVDVQRLAELPPGATVLLAVTPSISADALDWLNLNRPLVADLRLNIVLWCEADAAAVLARGAPDFFDWISARVDCPPAPAAFAVADVKAAIRARAPGIAWAGPGLEETLAAVRPGRLIRRVAVASYHSMIDALTSREPGWLFLEGIETDFHLRRLRWAMAETGRRVIVLRPAIGCTLPSWWTVHAEHLQIAAAVHGVIAAGGSGRLAALTGLDPTVFAPVVFLLGQGSDAAQLEDLLAAAADPRGDLEDLARPLGWTRSNVSSKGPPAWMSTAMLHTFRSETEPHSNDDSWVVSVLHEQPFDAEQWEVLGTSALEVEDFEVAIRWLNRALQLLPADANPAVIALILTQRGKAQYHTGNLILARADLEAAHAKATGAGDGSLLALSTAELGRTLVDLGEPQTARKHLESVLNHGANIDEAHMPMLLETLAGALLTQGDLDAARQHIERALAIRQRISGGHDDALIANSFDALGFVLGANRDLEGARKYLERSLEIRDRLGILDHPSAATTLRGLARIYRDIGHLDTARHCLERALALQQTALGEDHPEMIDTLTVLASVFTATGELDNARLTLKRTLSIQQRIPGAGGQLAGARIRRELANVLVAKGDLTGAIENLQQALATLRRIHERDDHPDVVATLRELERLQALQRDLQRPD